MEKFILFKNNQNFYKNKQSLKKVMQINFHKIVFNFLINWILIHNNKNKKFKQIMIMSV